MQKVFVVNHPCTKQLSLLLFPLLICISIAAGMSIGMSICMSICMAIHVAMSICGLVVAAKLAGFVCLVGHI